MIDRRRAARALVLAAWSAFFVWLGVSGELSRYLGPRTYWVVPFGAIVLGAAAVAHLLTLRASTPAAPTRGDAAGLVALLVPLLAVMIVPQPELGALAASRKAASSEVGPLDSFVPAPDPDGDTSFKEIHFASRSESYAAESGITDGTEVELVGFVSDADADGTFALTRFYVSCCAADAIPYSVAVDAPRDQQNDTWLKVRGTLTKHDDAFMVVADDVQQIEEPSDPYLY